jgi:hypothetical protein
MMLTRTTPNTCIYSYVHCLHIQTKPTLIAEEKSAIPLFSEHFYNTRVAMLSSVMVLVVAWPEAHMILVLLQAGRSQWTFMTQQVQYVPEFLPWMLFGWPPLLV